MTCGAPVISSRCEWGPEEILGAGEYGLLYDVGDITGLAASLTRVLNYPEEAAERSRKARRRVEEFSDSVVLPRLEKLFLSD